MVPEGIEESENYGWCRYLCEKKSEIIVQCPICQQKSIIYKINIDKSNGENHLHFAINCICGNSFYKVAPDNYIVNTSEFDSIKSTGVSPVSTCSENLKNKNEYYLLKLLALPASSSLDQITETYDIFRKKWNPNNFINDPDRYFEAQKVYNDAEIMYKAMLEHRSVKNIENYSNVNLDSAQANYPMLFLGKSGDRIEVRCGKCSKDSWIKVASAIQTPQGFQFVGEGECTCGNKFNCTEYDGNIAEIPTHGGLVTVAFLLGFGIVGGLCLGSYFRTKREISKGDYIAAVKSSANTRQNALFIIWTSVTALLAIVIFIYFKMQGAKY
ncbi:hypothetical protein [Geomonas ferrireducens]|uniref:hypothetical protein n=1 Tax=Geomonas ferrireducens TaxID=2570227 RepID=UPI0010A8C5C7|nr:hypothetical protein [Geomonas ferrireducens]